MGSQEAMSQGLLLQQAALALQMQGASTLYGVDPQQQADASTQALNAALRQQQYGAPRFRQLAQAGVRSVSCMAISVSCMAISDIAAYQVLLGRV